MCSVIKDVEEALVEFLLPKGSLGCDTDDDETLVWSRVDIDEFSFLWHEVGLASTFWVGLSLVKTVGNRHIHLDLYSVETYSILFISSYYVLIAIVPEQRMRLHLNQLAL